MEAPTQPTPPPDLAHLRAVGLACLRRLAGSTWTDHNAHDPGITILDQLSYALTDLAYRAGHSIPDLLAEGGRSGAAGSLLPPEAILTCNPVTPDDWRKLVLDIPGVRNAWVEPVADSSPSLVHDPGDNTLYFQGESGADASSQAHRLPVRWRGLYRVDVEADPYAGVQDADLLQAVSARLYAHRNLGEDFEPPTLLAPQWIAVQAEIEVGEVANPLELLETVYATLEAHLAPRVPFHTLDELLARGRSLDQIFSGPLLDHGFIDEDEMRRLVRRDGLRVSDAISALMSVPGIKTIHHISLGTESRQEAWYFRLAPGQTPRLDVARSSIQFRRAGIVWTPQRDHRARVEDSLRRKGTQPPHLASTPALGMPPGRNRHLARYRSIQQDLPSVYGVGPAGLPADAPARRTAQARQLAAYLLLFDQVLASSFSQLAHARSLVSFAPGPRPSYLPPGPINAPRASEVLLPSNTPPDPPEPDDPRTRRFLAHLLARFGEEFQDLDMVGQDGSRETSPSRHARRLDAQRAFLRDYPAISGGRARAFDYTRPSWGEANAANISGLEGRVARKLGLPMYWRRSLQNLGEDDPGGFHLIEHILLRPGKPDRDQWPPPGHAGWRPPVFLAAPPAPDPHSSQLTFVFPAWIKAFGRTQSPGTTTGFARFVEKTVREETPAHLHARVLWLDRDPMREFEDAYRTWLEALAGTL